MYTKLYTTCRCTSILAKHKTEKDFNINEQRALFIILVAMSAAVRGTF